MTLEVPIAQALRLGHCGMGEALGLAAVGTGDRNPPGIPEKTDWELQTRNLRDQVPSGAKVA
jgi:hypothetical protein